MRWKKVLAAAALLAVGVILAASIFLATYDFNKLKPRIVALVKDATGRDLVIAGQIDVGFGLPPSISFGSVRFQNAPWGSRPDLLEATRIDLQIKVWPLILGDLVFKRIHLVEPDFLLEFNEANVGNLEFETLEPTTLPEGGTDPSRVPTFIVKDLTVENGRFVYIDKVWDVDLNARIESGRAKIPGLNKPLHVEASGAVQKIPLTVNGTFGPIWAWIDPKTVLSTDLTLISGGATAFIRGTLQDPLALKGFTFNIVGNGPSTAEIARYAGWPDAPEFGPYRLTARVTDSDGKPALHILNATVGGEELAKVAIAGRIRDLMALQEIALELTATGQDVANLTQFGLPPLPIPGPFRLTAGISDPKPGFYSADKLRIVIADHEIVGQVQLTLAKKIPLLTAKLSSEKFGLWPFTLDAQITGPVDTMAMPKLDVTFGTEDVAQVSLEGAIHDLLKLSGVDLNFRLHGRDLANLSRVFGRPVPLRGAFRARGKAIIPEPKQLQFPNLQVSIGENTFDGSIDLDLRGDVPHVRSTLSSRDLDASSIIPGEFADKPWVKALDRMDPFQMEAHLAGFAGSLSMETLNIQSGNTQFMHLEISGSIAKLNTLQDVDLTFKADGTDIGRLGQFYGGPMPVHGAFRFSGRIADSAVDTYAINDLGIDIGENKLQGRLDVQLAGNQPKLSVDISSRQLSLAPFAVPGKDRVAHLKGLTDFGPIGFQTEISGPVHRMALDRLALDLGREQLAKISVNGSVRDLMARRGMDLQFSIQGDNAAELNKLVGQAVPLEGGYNLSGRLTDPEARNYRVGDVSFIIGENHIRGRVDIDLKQSSPVVDIDVEAKKTTLAPVTVEALESMRGIPDLGPLKLTVRMVGKDDKFIFKDLDVKFGREDLVAIAITGKVKEPLVPRGMDLEFVARSNDLGNFEKLGGKKLSLQGALTLSGRFVDTAPNVYRTSSLKAIWGESEHTGWVELDVSGERPKVSAELASNKWDLRPLFTWSVPTSKPDDPASKPNAAKAKVFSSQPWNLKGLNWIDTDLRFRNQQILLHNFVMEDVEIHTRTDNGHLRITPFTFRIGEGNGEIVFDLNAGDTPPVLKITVRLDQLDIGSKLKELEREGSVEGKLDVDLRLNGSGESMAVFMAGLNGEIRTGLKDGRVVSRSLEALERYMGSGILQLINPFQARTQYTPINCLVTTVTITDGVADVKVLLDTDQITLISAGTVNLKTEGLNMGIRPSPKQTYGVTVSLRRLSQPFRLGGTLADPSLVIDPGRTFLTFGKFFGFAALGPIGIAAFFTDVSVGKKDACELADQVYASDASLEEIIAGDGSDAGEMDTGPPPEQRRPRRTPTGFRNEPGTRQ